MFSQFKGDIVTRRESYPQEMCTTCVCNALRGPGCDGKDLSTGLSDGALRVRDGASWEGGPARVAHAAGVGSNT
ncbi:hypothetical protein GCM10027590_63340 [Nocardiopsis nanhaiensis]